MNLVNCWCAHFPVICWVWHLDPLVSCDNAYVLCLLWILCSHFMCWWWSSFFMLFIFLLVSDARSINLLLFLDWLGCSRLDWLEFCRWGLVTSSCSYEIEITHRCKHVLILSFSGWCCVFIFIFFGCFFVQLVKFFLFRRFLLSITIHFICSRWFTLGLISSKACRLIGNQVHVCWMWLFLKL